MNSSWESVRDCVLARRERSWSAEDVYGRRSLPVPMAGWLNILVDTSLCTCY